MALGWFKMWRDAWSAGAARARAVAASATATTAAPTQRRGFGESDGAATKIFYIHDSNNNDNVTEKKGKSSGGGGGGGGGGVQLTAAVAAGYRHSLMSALSACAVNVSALSLDESAFEDTCPGSAANAVIRGRGYFDFCGPSCGCELGRRLELAGYSVIGPDAIETEVSECG